MDGLTEAMAKHHTRLSETMALRGRYGPSDCADREGIAGAKLARVVDGLLASASLLAAAALIARKAGPTIGGVSIAGHGAVGVGASAWVRLASRRSDHKSLVQRVRAISGLAPR